MIIKKHWTPKYIKDRLTLMYFEKRNPDKPWLTQKSVEFLEFWLKSADIGFEWGSGRSTIWFSKHVKKIISIEHNKNWYQKVNEDIILKKINNIELNYIELEEKDNNYSNIINKFDDGFFDFVLVDGRKRDECVLSCLNKIKNGGILIIDNIERYIPNKSKAPASIGQDSNPKSDKWADFLNLVKNYRQFWTTNGVSDTVIYFIIR